MQYLMAFRGINRERIVFLPAGRSFMRSWMGTQAKEIRVFMPLILKRKAGAI